MEKYTSTGACPPGTACYKDRTKRMNASARAQSAANGAKRYGSSTKKPKGDGSKTIKPYKKVRSIIKK
jgi:hypothetical protein